MACTDLGGCWRSPAMGQAIVISHFGFTESMPIWMSKKRWSKAVELRDDRWANYSFWSKSCSFDLSPVALSPGP
eukprot:3667641-Prymnesium_polylepis.2